MFLTCKVKDVIALLYKFYFHLYLFFFDQQLTFYFSHLQSIRFLAISFLHYGMSLRELHAHLYNNSPKYRVDDGNKTYWRWCRGNEVHALAMEYLRSKRVCRSSELSTRALQACQDLQRLRLLRVQENGQQSTYVYLCFDSFHCLPIY